MGRMKSTQLGNFQPIILRIFQSVLTNPAEPLVSEVYGRVGQQLDNIIGDARIQYIVGQINDEEFDAAIDLWMRSGGEEYIQEINELYEAAKAH